MSDQDRISPYNIYTISTRQVMRRKTNINVGIISWSNTKFSELTLKELYSWQWGKLQIWSGSLTIKVPCMKVGDHFPYETWSQLMIQQCNCKEKLNAGHSGYNGLTKSV